MSRGVAISTPDHDTDLLRQLTRLEERLGPLSVGARTAAAQAADLAQRILPTGGDAAVPEEVRRRYLLCTTLAGVLGRAPHELFRAAPGLLGGRGADLGRLRAAAGLDERAQRMVEDAVGDGVDLGALSAQQMMQALASSPPTALVEPLALAAATTAAEQVGAVVVEALASARLSDEQTSEGRELYEALLRMDQGYALSAREQAQLRTRQSVEVERRQRKLGAELRENLPRSLDAWIAQLQDNEGDWHAFVGVVAALYTQGQAAGGAFVATRVSDGITAASASIALEHFANVPVAERVLDGASPSAGAAASTRVNRRARAPAGGMTL